MITELAAPIVGFREWRLGHGDRLWPIARQADDPWPMGTDVEARCHSARRVVGTIIDHPSPAPSEICACGLHALYNPPPPSGGTVLGAVIGWGHLEAHQDGFRSQSMRLVALSDSVCQEGLAREALLRIADRYAVPAVKHEDLREVAHAHGAPMPSDLIPVVPLRLLSMLGEAQTAEMFELDDLLELTQHDNPPDSAWFVASHAVEIAIGGVALDADCDLRELEVRLVALLVAAHRWVTEPAVSDRDSLPAFRSFASLVISASSESTELTDLHPPSCLTWGRLLEIGARLPTTVPTTPRWVRRAIRHRSRPVEVERPYAVLRAIARAEPSQGGLVDEIWDAWRFLDTRVHERPLKRMATALHEVGSRSNHVLLTLLRRGGDRDIAADAVADPVTSPFVCSVALEVLARGDDHRTLRRWLAHPLADPQRVVRPVKRLPPTTAQALVDEILGDHPLSDAELMACLIVRGRAIGGLAHDRLTAHPNIHHALSRACFRAITSDQAARLLRERIADGSALMDTHWLNALMVVGHDAQLRGIAQLAKHVPRLPHSLARSYVTEIITAHLTSIGLAPTLFTPLLEAHASAEQELDDALRQFEDDFGELT